LPVAVAVAVAVTVSIDGVAVAFAILTSYIGTRGGKLKYFMSG
jgi:hypothetical protein